MKLAILLSTLLIQLTQSKGPLKLNITLKKSNSIISTNQASDDDIDFETTCKNEMFVNVCIGTPSQCFNLLIDTGSNRSWVLNKHSPKLSGSQKSFDYTLSNSFSNTKSTFYQYYGDGNVQGEECLDEFKIGKYKLPLFNFLLVYDNSEMSDIEGILGLGYKYSEIDKYGYRFSFIDQLYNYMKINRNVFTIKFTSQDKGKLIIGDIPKEIKHNIKDLKKCKISKINSINQPVSEWECDINKIKIGESVVDIGNHAALIDTGSNVTIVPSSILHKIKQIYFAADYFKFNYNGNDNGLAIICTLSDCDLTKFYENIELVFGKISLNIRREDLFTKLSSGIIRFNFMSVPGGQRYIIGGPFLKRYQIVFDKFEEYIGFYENSQ